jgi:outer membrane protein OmpA-like peptidoglycan-associated protein
LIPGLQIEVKGVGDANGQIIADQVRFNKESWKIAQQIEAATEATRGQVSTNAQNIQQNAQMDAEQEKAIASSAAKIGVNTADIKAAEERFDNLTEFDTKKEVTVTFETGKTDVSDEAKQQLAALAKEAQGMKGYLIEVKGFASTSGNAEQNQQLSDDRADNVVTFLHQQGIDLRHIAEPAAMGTTGPVAANDTEEGRLKNQRVEVKLLVNKGLASK